MRHPYTPSGNQRPAVAIVPVTLPNGTAVEAKLDTGAEWCCFHDGLIQGLSQQEARWIDTRDFSGLGGLKSLSVYQVALQIGGRTFVAEVAAGPQPRNVIGMNLLNEIVSTFDGPDGHVALTL